MSQIIGGYQWERDALEPRPGTNIPHEIPTLWKKYSTERVDGQPLILSRIITPTQEEKVDQKSIAHLIRAASMPVYWLASPAGWSTVRLLLNGVGEPARFWDELNAPDLRRQAGKTLLFRLMTRTAAQRTRFPLSAGPNERAYEVARRTILHLPTTNGGYAILRAFKPPEHY